MADEPPSTATQATPSINTIAPPARRNVIGQAAAAGGASPAGVDKEPYDADRTREKIAYFLLYIMLGIIVVLLFVALIYSARCWVNAGMCTRSEAALTILTTAITPIFTAMIGLIGSVVGFYFGSKQVSG